MNVMSAPSEAAAVPEAQAPAIEAEVISCPELKYTASRLTSTSKADDYNDADSAIAVSTIRQDIKYALLMLFVGIWDKLNGINWLERIKL